MPINCLNKTRVFFDFQSLLLGLIALLLLAGTGHCEILANHNKRGLRAYTIEGVLRLQEEDIDLGTAALILSRDWGTNKTVHVYRRKIDDMAEEILNRLKKDHVPADYRAIPVINAYLFDERGFSSIDNADNPNDLFLHVVLDKKRGYCLGLSVLYLAIAERVGLPMYGVVVPGHFFVRYDDGQNRFNIETTSGGGAASNEHYIERFNPPQHPQTLYMKNLTKKQTLGCFFNNLGNSYMAVGDTEKAFEILKSAVEINPLLSEAQINLGNIYLQKQLPRQAIEKYERAMRIIGQDDKILSNLGVAYTQMGDYRKAESYYKIALSIAPSNASVRISLGFLYIEVNQPEQAMNEFNAAIRAGSDDPQVWFGMARVYYLWEQTDNEIRAYEKTLSLSPNMVAALQNLGNAYLKNNRDTEAISVYQRAIALEPQNAAIRYNLAVALAKTQQHQQAITEYLTVIQLDAQQAEAYNGLAYSYYQLGEYEYAKVYAQKAQSMGIAVQEILLNAK